MVALPTLEIGGGSGSTPLCLETSLQHTREPRVMKQGRHSNCHIAFALPGCWRPQLSLWQREAGATPASRLREAPYGPGQAPQPQSPCPTLEMWVQNEIMYRVWGECSNSIQLLGQVLFVLLDRFIVI